MNKREKGLLAPIRIESTIEQLDRLPLRIINDLTHTKSKNKSKLVSDFAKVLTDLEIELKPSVTNPNVVLVSHLGKTLSYISLNRGKQFYGTLGLQKTFKSDEWNHFLRVVTERISL